jgi:lysosomal acid lipase/cholesteryl ester hydrolase
VNNRGTPFSHEHIEKDSRDMSSDYWDFSFHEMAKYDIKASISYIKKIKGIEKINCICHSQGCYQLFLSYTLNPEFNESSIKKIATMGAVLKISKMVNI